MPWLWLVPAWAWKALATAGIIGAAYWWAYSNGAQHATEKIEKQNAKAVFIASKARARSRAPGAPDGRLRDPFTID